MELQITLTLSDRLFGLLEDKLPNLGRRVEKALTKELGKQAREQAKVVVTAVTETAAPEVPEAPAENEAARPLGPEDARAALAETRRRLLGENYLEQKGTKAYKAITSHVKQIIMAVSGGQASNIPQLTPEQTAEFIAEIEALVLDEDGNISAPRTILKNK